MRSELDEALRIVKVSKAPEVDGIPAELIKNGVEIFEDGLSSYTKCQFYHHFLHFEFSVGTCFNSRSSAIL